jgi:hypothetical protein
MKMYILRGKAGNYAMPGEKPHYWANGALDEASALAYARMRNYEGQVIDVVGYSGYNSPQMKATLEAVRSDLDCFALYGFSAGGYTVWNLLHGGLTKAEKERLNLVVVLGSPGPPDKSSYGKGNWELIFRENPKEGHMAGPKALLARPRGSD